LLRRIRSAFLLPSLVEGVTVQALVLTAQPVAKADWAQGYRTFASKLSRASTLGAVVDD
jgi:hypothetical protein